MVPEKNDYVTTEDRVRKEDISKILQQDGWYIRDKRNMVCSPCLNATQPTIITYPAHLKTNECPLKTMMDGLH